MTAYMVDNKNLFKDPDKCNDYSVYPAITAFLPGGLAVIMVPPPLVDGNNYLFQKVIKVIKLI